MSKHEKASNGFVFPQGAYDVLKWISLVFLPALATLYFTLATILGWDNAGEVVGVITAVDTFLGVLLGISSANFKNSDANRDGDLVVDTSDPETDRYSLEITTPLTEIQNKGNIVLKVRKPEDSPRE